jgi:hypothetical protein
MVPYICYSFLNICIWDLGMRFGKFFLGSCDPNLVQSEEFQDILPTGKNLFFETLTP